uniref:SFRICE_012878 n=1 Tax=Spodoptera frugiperda TaxID=7108 RepID=A0A2H1VF74_SPOFR
MRTDDVIRNIYDRGPEDVTWANLPLGGPTTSSEWRGASGCRWRLRCPTLGFSPVSWTRNNNLWITQTVVSCGNRIRDTLHGIQLPSHRANRAVILLKSCRSTWRTKGEAFVQQWTSEGRSFFFSSSDNVPGAEDPIIIIIIISISLEDSSLLLQVS